MSPPCTLREGPTEDGQVEWTVTNPKTDDTLRILLTEIFSDSSHDLGVDPGLQKDGVEKHLQELLADHPATLSPGLTLVRREYPTAIGPVDLMCRDEAGASVAVEIKRRGDIDGVEQLTRYLELLNRDPLLSRCRPRHLRRPGDQAPGPRARHRPRHRLRPRRLRRPARARRPEPPPVLRHHPLESRSRSPARHGTMARAPQLLRRRRRASVRRSRRRDVLARGARPDGRPADRARRRPAASSWRSAPDGSRCR